MGNVGMGVSVCGSNDIGDNELGDCDPDVGDVNDGDVAVGDMGDGGVGVGDVDVNDVDVCDADAIFVVVVDADDSDGCGTADNDCGGNWDSHIDMRVSLEVLQSSKICLTRGSHSIKNVNLSLVDSLNEWSKLP